MSSQFGSRAALNIPSPENGSYGNRNSFPVPPTPSSAAPSFPGNDLNQQRSLWFIDFDQAIFEHPSLQQQSIDKIFQSFKHVINFPPQKQVASIGNYLSLVARALADIYSTLTNFLRVEEKLSVQPTARRIFALMVNILSIETKHLEFFFVRTKNFRYYRILASLLRLFKYLQFQYMKIKTLKGVFDDNFFENKKEVYLYIQQKIKETLLVHNQDWSTENSMNSNHDDDDDDNTEKQGRETSTIKRALLHLLNLLIIFNGGIIKDVTINKLLEEEYIQEILQNNMLYYQFRPEKFLEENHEVEMEEEIDPRLKRLENSDEEEAE